MKNIFYILLFISSYRAYSSAAISCAPNQIRYWSNGYHCITQVTPPPNNCYMCQQHYQHIQQPFPNWFSAFPPALYQPNPLPWWAVQGNFHYPNLHYPGAWNYPGMNAQYYPGQGQVFAAKPNVYVESIYSDKKFNFGFSAEKELSFLATTPALDEKNNWQGRVHQDRYEVDGIFYDYLFYDIRLPKEKMQFERGVCATREETVNWMLNDLKAMAYPAIALQDFEGHWRVKIPDYPYYCIYPQYNEQLDAALPVSISLENTRFVRSLYILVPHKKEPDVDEPQQIPFPILDSAQIRPKVIIKHENMFKEWGVAFMGE
jgi:hypothetical protein